MRKQRIAMPAFALVLAMAALSVRAFAQDRPCAADMEKFCKDSKGKERIECMKAHQDGLSDACKAKIAERKERGVKGHPCLADGEKLCPGTRPGDGKFMPCLKRHAAELSEACKARMEQNHPCMADMEKFCKDFKGKDRKECMKAHKDEVSEACKAKRAEHKVGHAGKGKQEKAGNSAETPAADQKK